jgi:hypothetical protein
VVLDGTWQYRNFVEGRGIQDEKLHFNANARLRGGWRAGASLLVEEFGYDEALYENYYIDMGTDTIPYVGTPRLPNLDYVLTAGTPEFKHFSGDVFLLWGRDENFFEWASADIVWFTLNLGFRPTEKLRADFSYNLQRIDRRTDGSNVGLFRIPRLKLEYQISRPLFVRLIGEYAAARTDSLRDESRTGRPVLFCETGGTNCVRAGAEASNTFRGDALVAYQPVPGTVVFAGYGSTMEETEAFKFRRMRRTRDGFFVKLSYLFRL